MIDKFHRRGEAEVRGVASPANFGASARSGVSLVELLIAMFILALVCIAWLQIIGIQSARREARRREAVERLSGMMDAFLYCYRQVDLTEFGDIYDHPAWNYRMIVDANRKTVEFNESDDVNTVYPVFDGDASSIGYRLNVVLKEDLPGHNRFGSNWGVYSYWLVGSLYERSGALKDAGKPFFTLSVCMGKPYVEL